MDIKKPEITPDKVKTLFETPFIRLYDLQYEEGRHYFDATRREKEELVAVKSDEAFKNMLADAATSLVVLKSPGEEPKMLAFYEYRYPLGQFVLSIPAGLIDEEDRQNPDAARITAKREIYEETGIIVKDTDFCRLLSPVLFSTPGMTDESNALVLTVVEDPDLSGLSSHGTGGELFGGFRLLTKADAAQILRDGKDEYGKTFSLFTWYALTLFVSGLWADFYGAEPD